jgi:hypothetical protein
LPEQPVAERPSARSMAVKRLARVSAPERRRANTRSKPLPAATNHKQVLPADPYPITVYCDVVTKLTVTLLEGDFGTNPEEVEGLHAAATAPPRLQEIESGKENPAIGAMVAVVEIASPAMTFPEVGLNAIAKSTPFPVMVAAKPL